MIVSPRNGTNDFIICLKSNHDRAIGKVGVFQNNRVQFILDRPYWRRGYMREAMLRLIPYLFNVRGYARLTAEVHVRNEAAGNLLGNLGFELCVYQHWLEGEGFVWPNCFGLVMTKERWETCVQDGFGFWRSGADSGGQAVGQGSEIGDGGVGDTDGAGGQSSS